MRWYVWHQARQEEVSDSEVPLSRGVRHYSRWLLLSYWQPEDDDGWELCGPHDGYAEAVEAIQADPRVAPGSLSRISSDMHSLPDPAWHELESDCPGVMRVTHDETHEGCVRETNIPWVTVSSSPAEVFARLRRDGYTVSVSHDEIHDPQWTHWWLIAVPRGGQGGSMGR